MGEHTIESDNTKIQQHDGPQKSDDLRIDTTLIINTQFERGDEMAMSPLSPPSPMATALPKGQMIALTIIFFCEAYNFTYIFSFIGFMVVDFGLVENKKDSGYYAGLIASTFATCQFFSGFVYGYISDLYSKKRVMLIGSVGTSVFSLAFGFSMNFPMAIVFRSMCGALNGNVSTAKSYLAEMTDSTNQSRAFSLQQLSWNLGAILGPAISGFLSRPTKQYPGLFEIPFFSGSIKTFMDTFPYFIPAATSSVLMIVGLFVGQKYLVSDPSQITKPHTAQSLVDYEQETKSNPVPKVAGNPFKKLATSFVTVVNKDFVMVVLCYMATICITVSLDEVFPLFSMLPIEEGGLGFNTLDIGIVQALCGVSSVLIQLFLYQRCVNRFGKLGTARLGMSLQLFMMLLPEINFVAKYGKVAMWASVCLFSINRSAWGSFSFTSLFILIANSAPPGKSGMANGLSHSFANIPRMLTPVIAGPLFAWTVGNQLVFPLDVHLAFIIMSTLTTTCIIITLFMPRTLNEQKKEVLIVPVIEEEMQSDPVVMMKEKSPIKEGHTEPIVNVQETSDV
ncbi:hypothetical protein AKO1_012250 [Acrasis kona]|uniref:Major facilitator superfamily (MFS) profile domain-containing protein n=1 Tax=Acrasis kona TaxID=1008807 RepID=A0AAW2Z9R5_9EUKA